MRLLDLFSGIGGFSLAAKWVWGDELEIVGFVEIDSFCQKILRKNFPGVPIYDDIKKIQWVVADSDKVNGNDGRFNASEISFEQKAEIQRVNTGQIDLLTAGFPCQPFSAAGRRAGEEDDRYLWPETIRTIREVKPRWICLENVAGLLSILEPGSLSPLEVKEIELFLQDENYPGNEVMERIHGRIIGKIIQEIEEAGYVLPRLADGTPIVLCLPACAQGAPHRRDRVWIVANSKNTHAKRLERGGNGKDGESKESIRLLSTRSNRHAPDTESTGNSHMEECRRGNESDIDHWKEHWYEVATRFCGVDDGVPSRVDRLKSLGNAIVPQIAEQIFRAIKESGFSG